LTACSDDLELLEVVLPAHFETEVLLDEAPAIGLDGH